MRQAFRLAAACAALFAIAPAIAADMTLATAKELKWTDLAEPKGARQAVLWGDATGENAMLVRWPFNTKLTDVVRNQDVHIFVHAGTFTVDAQGTYKEFGPSGVLVIPKGVKHTLGCEAAGECRFVVHHPGAVEVTKAK
jgi:quercetin dioxygenase-like cupin family protein